MVGPWVSPWKEEGEAGTKRAGPARITRGL